MKIWFKNALAFVAVAAASMASQAEDIDLFLGLPADAVEPPNVLFVIDNTANWSQTSDDGNAAWTIEQQALAAIFRALPPGEVNVGLLMYTESGTGNSNVDGGYIRAAIRNMDEDTKELYAAQIESFDIIADQGNGGKSGLGFAEAYHYFAGLAPYAGNNKVKTDYQSNPDGTVTRRIETVIGTAANGRPITETTEVTLTADQDVWNLPGNALNSKGGSPYNKPVEDGFCGKNYIIFISNGANQDNTSDTRTAETLLSNLGGDTSQISITPSGSADNASDEWARFMRESSLAITTFTIDVNKVTTGQGPGWSALLQSIAAVSDGQYYEVDGSVQGIVGAINDALSRILAVNSVFASVALPASANTQSTFLNQVYIGMFRPDENADPRWLGNLKQYKLGFDNSTGSNILRVLDADDAPVVDPGTGFVNECARSFWTPTSVDNYWSFLNLDDQRGNCLTVAGYTSASNFPDGPVVEKGAQAYRTRLATPATRVVKTAPTSFCAPAGTSYGVSTCTLPDLATGNMAITEALLGAADSAERIKLINWARGADTEDEDGDLDVSEMRPSVHGDIIHSQPIAIDYAADPNDPAVVVIYGGNDGLLRAINGNRATSHDGTNIGSGEPAGDEFWTFMPVEFYDKIKRNLDNDMVVKFPASGASAGASGEQKPYGADGPITAFDDGATKYLYLGMRRGGRSVYALDVSNINSPSLKWRLGCDDTGCVDSDWSRVGQTWSPMNIAYVDGQSTHYLLMGGGYDACEDHDDPTGPANHDCSSGTTGNLIYVLNGDSGEIVATFDTDRSVPGAVTVVPVSDNNSNILFAYAADTGGNIYRLSGSDANTPIGTTTPDNWTITKIATLGCGPRADDTCDANRKFLFGPDVVRIPNSARFALLVGSGDREKPLEDYGAATSVTNYFFSIIDSPLDPLWLEDSGSPAVCRDDIICVNALTTVDIDGPVNDGDVIGEKGWKLQLRSKEQVISGALTVADVVNFSTHIPAPGIVPDGECASDLGTATTYNIGFDDGEGTANNITGGGLVPTPVAGKVILDNGQIVPFCIGCGGEGSAIGGSEVTSGITWSQPKSRVYWKIEK